MKKIPFQAFTLVELIVVITILVILWTIGFVSYTNYIGWARDTNRLSQIAGIYDGIESYKIKQEAPLPTDKVEVKSGTTVIAYQWYVWQDVLDTISYNILKAHRNLSKYFFNNTYFKAKNYRKGQRITLRL